MDPLTARIADVLREFDWDNYGFDEIGAAIAERPDDQEWIPALAAQIAAEARKP